ncbi:MAG: hypothetical protein ACI4KA_01755 [Oscillospiraceae bacterium]
MSEILSKAKPILFNTEMVRAVLDGRKTVTRRVALPNYDLREFRSEKYPKGWWIRGRVYKDWDTLLAAMKRDECKCRYRKGDILYVRETWQYGYRMDDNDQIIEGTGRYWYAADNDAPFNYWVNDDGSHRDTMPWRPSIHMPKEAARIFLQVTDVRVERLQEINADGIRNEGLTSMAVHVGDMEIAQAEFALLWNSTIKKSDLDRYGWSANPWVWVVEFERLEVQEWKTLN